MAPSSSARLLLVTNIAPNATRDHMRTLFGYIGRIEEIKMFPPDDSPLQVSSRVCYVRYDSATDAATACHLTNTVFIDRAIIIQPVEDGRIPDEATAMLQAAPPGTVAGVLPTSSTWPLTVVNQVIGTGNGQQLIMTRDPELTKRGLPPYPPLPATMDATKIDEIRRTVMVENLAATTMPEPLMTYFSQVGEIKYVRMAGLATESTRTALIEFSCQTCVPTALTYNGGMFNGRTIKVSHSTTAIIKPMPKADVPSKEVEEAMKKVKEAQALISGAVDSEYRAQKRSRSRSPRRRRSRSRSRRRARRSRSRPRASPQPPRSRRRSRSPRRRSRTRSPPRRRSRSRSRRRSRSPRRRRSRSKSRRRRSRRSKSRSPNRRRRSRSGSASKDTKASKPTSSSPVKKASTSPKRKSSRSPKRPKRRSRSRSPRRRRSRSDSRSRKNRKDRKRSRSRDRKKKSKTPPEAEKPEIKRDYDAEEKGFEDGEEKKPIGPAPPPDIKQELDIKKEMPSDVTSPKKEMSSPPPLPPHPPEDEVKIKNDNLQQEDMDMDSSSE